ncbi:MULTISPECIES: methionyl-tRNA formyltransferase [Legionella]|uniref:Methionyl-tRNA formyltransferase n=1 Tax=Legionella septentrionalis TaxID=2498109 RepID=A0A433JLG7_9GAMM|nr:MULTISPECIES: methionyl-tRNA formyltransferase [Legionella]MCP0913982.1 methionyl-tRNA formyltransferase [Legionella sp. 27cVA30]RUQ90362.1 methionyl-tRNA formyltransferase [Legionella septentrionalis]RUR00013.1 methionyl-tRNA formyltransferase [Legionella septentrionalis]RUR10709.1 methionyl-tRNA formyltransferase [Legionella septentrionalis]RUR16538.1 methionyl-tRNA formyltransferase [Legionella septentrionalis]
MKKLNIVFAGTPEFALPSLQAIALSGHNLAAIYTQPDRPAGRGRRLQASPVKEWAESQHVPVYQPVNFKEPQTVTELATLKPDLMVVIAYGLILPRAVLEIPPHGCINVHASLLPRWRGASPIQHAVLHGDKETGVTIMQMDVGMDTGNMLAKASCFIHPEETAGQLHDRLAQLAVAPLLAALHALSQGSIIGEQQDSSQATYAPKINKEDALIDWHKPAEEIDRQIRAFNPWPIAYTHANEEPVRIHQAHIIPQTYEGSPGTIVALNKKGMLVATGKHALLVQRLQFAGGKAMSVADWLNAARNQLYLGLVLR